MWPDDYYREMDGAQRKKLLDEALENPEERSGDTGPEDGLRLKLWQTRYRDSGGQIDYFMKAWLDLSLTANNQPPSGKVRQKRAALEAARALMLDHDRRSGGLRAGEADILTKLCHSEYVHLFHLIIHLYLSDYGFTHHVLGIGKLDADAVRRKVAQRLASVTRELPARLELSELFGPLERAASQAYAETFEDCE